MPRGDDTWRFDPVISHGVQPGGNVWNLDIARENLQIFFLNGYHKTRPHCRKYKPINHIFNLVLIDWKLNKIDRIVNKHNIYTTYYISENPTFTYRQSNPLYTFAYKIKNKKNFPIYVTKKKNSPIYYSSLF
jgi:hypothetical protein